METLYKILKIIIVLLTIAVMLVAGWRKNQDKAPAHPETAPVVETVSANAAPDFTVYDLEGNPVKLSDFRGQPVILNVWASWCGPCKAEMPDLEEAYQTHGDEIAFLTGQSNIVQRGDDLTHAVVFVNVFQLADFHISSPLPE